MRTSEILDRLLYMIKSGESAGLIVAVKGCQVLENSFRAELQVELPGAEGNPGPGVEAGPERHLSPDRHRASPRAQGPNMMDPVRKYIEEAKHVVEEHQCMREDLIGWISELEHRARQLTPGSPAYLQVIDALHEAKRRLREGELEPGNGLGPAPTSSDFAGPSVLQPPMGCPRPP